MKNNSGEIGARMPLCPVHKQIDERGTLEMEIGGNCVACSLNERTEMLQLLASALPPKGVDAVTFLRQVMAHARDLQEKNNSNTQDQPSTQPSEPAVDLVAGQPIYVASRASIPERGQMWRDFRANGVNITSTWIDEDGADQTGDFGELWERISNEIAESVAVVLYAEPDDFPLKGAFIEAGIALGMGKPVIVCLPGMGLLNRTYRPIGSWIAHPLVTRCDDVKAAVRLASTQPTKSGVAPAQSPDDGVESSLQHHPEMFSPNARYCEVCCQKLGRPTWHLLPLCKPVSAEGVVPVSPACSCLMPFGSVICHHCKRPITSLSESSSAPSTLKCKLCGHSDGTFATGICRHVDTELDCLCKCEFPSTPTPDAPDDYWALKELADGWIGTYERDRFEANARRVLAAVRADSIAVPATVEAGEGPSSTEYEKWLATRPDLIARFEDKTFRKNSGYEIWRNAWLIHRSSVAALITASRNHLIDQIAAVPEGNEVEAALAELREITSLQCEIAYLTTQKPIRITVWANSIIPMSLFHAYVATLTEAVQSVRQWKAEVDNGKQFSDEEIDTLLSKIPEGPW